MKYIILRTAGFLATALTIAGGWLTAVTTQASAQAMFKDEGTLAPAEETYDIDIEDGDVLAIILTSEDFDTVLTLLGPDGEEVAFNDDFGGSLNSRIIYSATAAGSYTVITKSFDGQGGDYSLEVRPATAYEVSQNEAQTLLQTGDYDGAIMAYSEAIELDSENPEAYLGRADAYFAKAQSILESEGRVLEGPDDLPPDIQAAIVSDFQTAAELYDAAEDPATAQSLREQIQFIETGEIPGPAGGVR